MSVNLPSKHWTKGKNNGWLNYFEVMNVTTTICQPIAHASFHWEWECFKESNDPHERRKIVVETFVPETFFEERTAGNVEQAKIQKLRPPNAQTGIISGKNTYATIFPQHWIVPFTREKPSAAFLSRGLHNKGREPWRQNNFLKISFIPRGVYTKATY